MSKALQPEPPLSQLYQAFLEQLKQSSFKGDIGTSYGERIVMATDNSVYQRMPQAIVYPRSKSDVKIIMRLAGEAKWRDIVLTPRGGGTGTNGQSLSDGVIVDLSRHMNTILEINVAERWVRVETGVIKDQLNAELKKYGLFFAPELSTSNRATIGGMINTDACGQGSCTYGKTRHHVLELDAVLMDGTELKSLSISNDQLEALCERDDRIGGIYQIAGNIAKTRQNDIQKYFPKLNRSLTGYDLAHLIEEDNRFNLNSILCGSEGSLAFLVEAKLNVLPIPKYAVLINISYTSFMAALRDAQTLMTHHPISIETVDSRVLGLAMEDNIWRDVAEWFPEFKQKTEGINLVEFNGDNINEVDAKVAAFIKALEQDGNQERLGSTIAKGPKNVTAIYTMRKKAVGLLGNMEGEARPQPFVEDTAVPPEKLADYIADFRTLLDNHHLQYGMFGHVDAGVLHVRPALDMKNPEHAKLIRPISDAVMKLTQHYGGVIWGEHGKGLRSEYVPDYFGPLYECLQQIKTAFDPYNQLNPGKIATPEKSGLNLTRLDEVGLRADRDKFIPQNIWKEYGASMHCNGNGACFNYDLNDAMCPSYKATRQRIHSPKGRASLMREFLRLENGGKNFKKLNFFARLGQTLNNKKNKTFANEVYDAMAGCLACKSCVGQCPIKVNVPDLKTRFLDLYHRRYLRPLRDHMVGRLETFLPLLAKFPKFGNFLLHPPLINGLVQQITGLIDTPKLEIYNFRSFLCEYQVEIATPEKLKKISKKQHEKTVIIVQDAFTRYFETSLLANFIKLATHLGYKVFVTPFTPNGKPLNVLGFTKAFERTAFKNAKMLQALTAFDVPLVGLDPAMTLVYRQEYKKIKNLHCPNVLLPQEWLVSALPENAVKSGKTYQLLAHCTEKTNEAKGTALWIKVFKKIGLDITMPATGCCGMSGTYGHEKQNQHTSKVIFSQSWEKVLEKADIEQVETLATGYSCRSQVDRFKKTKLRHPIQVLLNELF